MVYSTCFYAKVGDRSYCTNFQDIRFDYLLTINFQLLRGITWHDDDDDGGDDHKDRNNDDEKNEGDVVVKVIKKA